MKCLILAAGYATRLYPLTENFPKPLLKMGEKSILDWLVDDLVDTTDIDEFVVISNHKFAQHFENWKNEKVKVRPYTITVIDDGTSTNETRLGAVKDIRLAVEKLNLADDLLVMAGDNVLDFSLSKFVDFAKEKNTSCVMCHEENELKKLYEIMVDTDGIYGGRFSGAGFKGCCMALIDPNKAEDIEAKVTAEYLKAFPALDGKYSFHLCESADGVEL